MQREMVIKSVLRQIEWSQKAVSVLLAYIPRATSDGTPILTPTMPVNGTIRPTKTTAPGYTHTK